MGDYSQEGCDSNTEDYNINEFQESDFELDSDLDLDFDFDFDSDSDSDSLSDLNTSDLSDSESGFKYICNIQ